MPIYDYGCRSCGHQFELRQGFDAEPLTECPGCGELAKRKFSVPTVIYKGSGFYTTDYKRKESDVSQSDEPKSAEDKTESGDSASGAKSETANSVPKDKAESGDSTSGAKSETANSVSNDKEN